MSQLSWKLTLQGIPGRTEPLVLEQQQPGSVLPPSASINSTSTDEDGDKLQERPLTDPLLENGKDATAPSSFQSAASTPVSSTGWTLSSPVSSLQSDVLLRAVYGPSWQALPGYTHYSCAQCLCCYSCGCPGPKHRDWVQQTWTTRHVTKVEVVELTDIRGVPPCQAVRLHLRPLQQNIPEIQRPVPTALQDEWEEQMIRMEESSQQDEASDTDGLILTLALSSDVDAPLLWKVDVPSAPAVCLASLTVLDGRLSAPHQPTHMYINGFQSWSFTGSIPRGSPQPQPALPGVFSAAFNRGGLPPPEAETFVGPSGDGFPVHYQSDFFGCFTSDGPWPPPGWSDPRVMHRPVHRLAAQLKERFQDHEFAYQNLDETGGPALVLGWLSQHKQYGIIQADVSLTRLRMHTSCQQILSQPITTDWGYAQLLLPHSYDEEPLVHYLHAVAAFHEARPLHNGSLLTGWCSWYHYYENIAESTLRENFASLAALRTQVPTNVAVVDDGYMTAWGDWDSLKPRKFTDMGQVARDISSFGMRAGLWLAPFAADKHSKIAKQHPDWIIGNDAGRPANSSNCGKFFYGLDATNPHVREYVFNCIKRAVHEWDFDVLKIDFLYAACLDGNGKYDLSMSRAETMNLAMQTIRDAAGPDVFLIGCGLPVANGIGFVDGMRVSADTGPTWYPALPLPWWDHGTLPCLRSMVRNSMTRASMGHRFWHNDPDCLLLGETTRLTDAEVASAASIVAMTCGMMLLSDDLTKITETRKHILSKIFPMTGVPGIVLDLHSTNDGLPSLLRLWCTDQSTLRDTFLKREDIDLTDHNAEATHFARMASYTPQSHMPPPDERNRSCIHVTKGLGTWTVVSISNWLDTTTVVHVPPPALFPPTELQGNGGLRVNGFHVLAFWSSQYSWIPDPRGQMDSTRPPPSLSKKLTAHETEIFHIKPVEADEAQYIGSDLHFSCGNEVRICERSRSKIFLAMKTQYHRVGHVFVFLPRTNLEHIQVKVNGQRGRWEVVGNTPTHSDNGSPRLLGRVIRIPVVIHANQSPQDGCISIDF